jgi:hypothetical protein
MDFMHRSEFKIKVFFKKKKELMESMESYRNKSTEYGGTAQAGKSLPSKHKVLSSKPSTKE